MADRSYGDKYAKIWTSIMHDERFLGLTCVERGLWVQLIVLAKIQGGTGRVCHSSVSALSTACHLHRSTCYKIVTKLASLNMVKIIEHDNGVLDLELPKYMYYQEVKGAERDAKNGTKVRNNGAKVLPHETTRHEYETTRHEYETNIPFEEIIFDLNSVAGSGYRVVERTKELIRARWNEGFRLEDFKHVHRVKHREWQGTDFQKFLRPQTLYSNKFEGYRQQPETDLVQKYGKEGVATMMAAERAERDIFNAES